VSAAVVAEPLEPQQVVVQDDLDQLLDMLPADLGSMLINHPKRPQLIEVSKLRATAGLSHSIRHWVRPLAKVLKAVQKSNNGSGFHGICTPRLQQQEPASAPGSHDAHTRPTICAEQR
jgi:hypothetical protein